MSDRSFLTVTLNEPPDPLPPGLIAILSGHDDVDGAALIWNETALGTGEEIADQLRAAAPDLEFVCQQEGHYEFDGYRITAAAGQPLREVTITHSGRPVPEAHTITDLLGAATTLDGARTAVISYLEAEGAL